MFFKVIFVLLPLFSAIYGDSPVISLNPQSLDLYIGDNDTITVSLSNTTFDQDKIIRFFYDDKSNSSQNFIEPLSDIVFGNSTHDKQTSQVSIIAQHEGHLVLTVKESNFNASQNNDFILIDIGRYRLLNIFTIVVGWIYFAAWSVSFYPQIYTNWRRKSVVGLNFDFLMLNILGHSCYSVYNVLFFWSHDVQNEYRENNPHSVIPVLLNDVVFSCHAVFACIVTIIQCLIYERGSQRVSKISLGLALVMIIFLIITTCISIAGKLSILNLIYYFSYVKLAITIIKYCPQAYMNFRRKSTEGWSIGNILLDFTGGALSILQMFFLAINYNDWGSIFGSPTKFGLGFFSILFDLLFILQHYVCYRKRAPQSDEVSIIPPNESANLSPYDS